MPKSSILSDNTSLYPALVMAISALVAFILYHQYQWTEGYWSIITIASVTQTRRNSTLFKISLRITGTLLGAFTGYYFVFLLPDLILMPAFFICIFISVLITLAANKYRYLMITTGLTFTLVLAAALTDKIAEMALIRTYEVIAGSLICSSVSLILSFLFPNVRGEPLDFGFQLNFKKSMLLEALLMSMACGLTFFTWQWFRYPLGFWATISCLYVLEENVGKTVRNALRRISIHGIVALIAGVLALNVSADNPYIIIPLIMGLFVCGYCLGLKFWLADSGNTMAGAFSVMLLVSAPGLSQPEIVLARFLNVFYGSSIAFLIIYLAILISDRKHASTNQTTV